MAGDHEAPHFGKLPKAWTRVLNKKESPKSLSQDNVEQDKRYPESDDHWHCMKIP